MDDMQKYELALQFVRDYRHKTAGSINQIKLIDSALGQIEAIGDVALGEVTLENMIQYGLAIYAQRATADLAKMLPGVYPTSVKGMVITSLAADEAKAIRASFMSTVEIIRKDYRDDDYGAAVNIYALLRTDTYAKRQNLVLEILENKTRYTTVWNLICAYPANLTE